MTVRHAPNADSEALVGCAIGRARSGSRCARRDEPAVFAGTQVSRAKAAVGPSAKRVGGCPSLSPPRALFLASSVDPVCPSSARSLLFSLPPFVVRNSCISARRGHAAGGLFAANEGKAEVMAAVSCRAIFAVRWYEVSRVLSVTSSLAATRDYRKETWCRRWWHISQRSLSMSASSFAPSLSPILSKTRNEPRASTTSMNHAKTVAATSQTPEESSAEPASDVTVVYHRGLPRITIPLPSRKEHCVFTLKPITHTVGDFLQMLKTEDRGIDRAAVTTIDGIRIGSSNSIESLMEEDFKLIINDTEYTVIPPLHHRHTTEDLQKLSDVQTLVCELYETLHVREHHADMERQVMAELEAVRLELEPLEQQLQELETTAARKANLFVWTCLVLMSVQFGGLARLTWWEYSWDIMEPVTYFVTYGTTMGWFIYFLLTKQEYMLPDVLNRRHLVSLHKKAKKAGLDIDLYNRLKDRAYELEMTLKIIRGPLYEHKQHLEQKQNTRERSSSSSSRSPSSSPSPSPERQVSKKTTGYRSPQKSKHEEANPETKLS